MGAAHDRITGLSVRFASLGSGSHGNATLIEQDDHCLLIDLGFSIKETEKRLRRLGRTPADITAILVTHEHGDHIHGVAPFARKYDIPVHMTPGTYNSKKLGQLPRLNLVDCHEGFSIDEFEISPVPVPHDAREPCQYLITADGRTLGVLTDLGHVTRFVEEQYRHCDALMLECNHDAQMLASGPYSNRLKKRVAGNYGHLSNKQALTLVEQMDLDRLQHLVIAHVSEKNNTPALALDEIRSVSDRWPVHVWVADQSDGLDWIALE
jgi:phosphoribosyl 1,2-cyclic phosphodiesterase